MRKVGPVIATDKDGNEIYYEKWRDIPGYLWPYRINEEGDIQKFWNGAWVNLRPYLSGGRARAMVKMRSVENKPVDVPLVWLVADAFMGGRRPGMAIIHKNGSKLDCGVRNLRFVTRREAASLSWGNRRRPVMKISRDGEVVDIYPSVTAAAKANYISKNSIWARCTGRVADPYSLDGYDYRYESPGPGRRRKAAEELVTIANQSLCMQAGHGGVCHEFAPCGRVET